MAGSVTFPLHNPAVQTGGNPLDLVQVETEPITQTEIEPVAAGLQASELEATASDDAAARTANPAVRCERRLSTLPSSLSE